MFIKEMRLLHIRTLFLTYMSGMTAGDLLRTKSLYDQVKEERPEFFENYPETTKLIEDSIK